MEATYTAQLVTLKRGRLTPAPEVLPFTEASQKKTKMNSGRKHQRCWLISPNTGQVIRTIGMWGGKGAAYYVQQDLVIARAEAAAAAEQNAKPSKATISTLGRILAAVGIPMPQRSSQPAGSRRLDHPRRPGFLSRLWGAQRNGV